MTSIEDAQRITNFAVQRASLQEQIETLQNTVPDGIAATVDAAIAEKQAQIAALNADHRAYSRAEFTEALDLLKLSLAALQADNATITEQNALLRANLDAQIAEKQAALAALTEEEQTLLRALVPGAPAVNAPAIESRITDLEDMILTMGGV